MIYYYIRKIKEHIDFLMREARFFFLTHKKGYNNSTGKVFDFVVLAPDASLFLVLFCLPLALTPLG